MKKWLFLPLLALLLSGCSFLLERSYSVEKPYTDRYWDSEIGRASCRERV